MSAENGENWTRERMRRRLASIIEAIEGRPRSNERTFIKSAIAEAQGMKFKPITLDEIVARLAELKAGIFKAERFEEIDMPFPDVGELQRSVN